MAARRSEEKYSNNGGPSFNRRHRIHVIPAHSQRQRKSCRERPTLLSRTLMKFNSPIPQSLPKECAKAAKICACPRMRSKEPRTDRPTCAQSSRSWTARITASTVSYPEISSSMRRALQYSASSKPASCSQREQVRGKQNEMRGSADRFESGSGVVIARLDNGSMCIVLPSTYMSSDTSSGWSAPSAIGTAGVCFGSQAGAEVTDFLIVLNTRSVRASLPTPSLLALTASHSGYCMCFDPPPLPLSSHDEPRNHLWPRALSRSVAT